MPDQEQFTPQDAASMSQTPVPTITYGKDTDPILIMDPHEAAQTLRELGVSDQGISDTTVYMDPKSRLQTFGTHYPNQIGRLRFRSNPEIKQTKGDIIRLSTVMKGKPRTPEEINRTFVHEGEHRAQEERHDRKLTEGHVAIYGLMLAGALLGNRLGRGKVTKTIGTVLGAGLGHTSGYMIAPHERQARARARTVTSTAVSKK